MSSSRSYDYTPPMPVLAVDGNFITYSFGDGSTATFLNQNNSIGFEYAEELPTLLIKKLFPHYGDLPGDPVVLSGTALWFHVHGPQTEFRDKIYNRVRDIRRDR